MMEVPLQLHQTWQNLKTDRNLYNIAHLSTVNAGSQEQVVTKKYTKGPSIIVNVSYVSA